ncbi:MAG: c-type cytochrome [Lysobacterales bacterium]
MEEQTDSVFIRNISIVIALLVVFTITIAFLAGDIGGQEAYDKNPSRTTTTEERIKPVADVYMGEAGAAAMKEAAASTGSEKKVAFDGSLDGEMIYGKVCSACHATGAAGAPMRGSDAMAERAQKGVDTLVQNAVNGLNAMPPRGGRPDLSDEQIRAIVEYMIQ